MRSCVRSSTCWLTVSSKRLSRSLRAVMRSCVRSSTCWLTVSSKRLSRSLNIFARLLNSRSLFCCCSDCAVSTFIVLIWSSCTSVKPLAFSISTLSASLMRSHSASNFLLSCLRIYINTFSAFSSPLSSAIAVSSFSLSSSSPFTPSFLRTKFKSGRFSCICFSHLL